MSFGTQEHPCNCHTRQDSIHFDHLRRLSYVALQSMLPFTPISMKLFVHSRLALPFLQSYINATMLRTFSLCMSSSFTPCADFEIDPLLFHVTIYFYCLVEFCFMDVPYFVYPLTGGRTFGFSSFRSLQTDVTKIYV